MVAVSSKSRTATPHNAGDAVSMGANGARREAFQAAAIQQNYGSNFARSMKGMILLEGNYGSNLGDGAGYTFCGLTQKHNGTGSASTANGMSIGSVNRVYRDKYWSNVGLDQVAAVDPAFAFRCFDAHVNSGRGGLSHMLTFVCSRLGIEGGKSVQSKMAAILQAIKDHRVSEADVHRECHTGRMAFYRRCRQWGEFAKGWTNRMTKVAKIVAEIRNTPFNPADIDYSAFSEGNNSSAGFFGPFIPTPSGFISFGTRLFSMIPGGVPPLSAVLSISTGGKREISEEEGEALGKQDAKKFTQQFGPAKRTIDFMGLVTAATPKPKEPESQKLKLKPDSSKPLAYAPNSNEAALTQIQKDTERAARKVAAHKEKDPKPSLFGWKMFSN